MIKSSFAIAATAVTVLSLVQPAMAQSDDSKLGTVNFETSCNPEAQKLFNPAMLTSTRSGIARRNRSSRMR